MKNFLEFLKCVIELVGTVNQCYRYEEITNDNWYLKSCLKEERESAADLAAEVSDLRKSVSDQALTTNNLAIAIHALAERLPQV